MVAEAGGGHLLSRLVSSACCPRLRRLRLVWLELPGMEEESLLIHAGELLELSLLEIDDLRFLELRTSSLRVLQVNGCYGIEGLTVSAPRLEDLEFLVEYPLHIDGDLSSVARLKIELCSHAYLDDDKNDGSIRLLECCRLIRCLEVCLDVSKVCHLSTHLIDILQMRIKGIANIRKKQDVDIIKSSIPQLPHVASLKIHVTQRDGPCSYGAGIARLLAQCNSIRYLNLSFCYNRVAEFEKLMGTDDELQFIQFILKRASGVAFNFDRNSGKKAAKTVLNLCHALAGGSWTTRNDANLSYNYWRRCA
ncbi:putative FBD-associated F-box protein [Panicum miliaceum]|uniref:FBD-associated F-box protein n=1 Tax=Panicum miliaceum TaxID=4540 RepID=A0A3L6Q3K1_PANMI|nr:putative FBD-associated F-box protein [Panicum miliaceum]